MLRPRHHFRPRRHHCSPLRLRSCRAQATYVLRRSACWTWSRLKTSSTSTSTLSVVFSFLLLSAMAGVWYVLSTNVDAHAMRKTYTSQKRHKTYLVLEGTDTIRTSLYFRQFFISLITVNIKRVAKKKLVHGTIFRRPDLRNVWRKDGAEGVGRKLTSAVLCSCV